MRWAFVFLPLMLGACGADQFCPGDVAPGIVVQVRDAATEVSVAALARGEIRSGSYTDSLAPYEVDAEGILTSLTAGRGRPGTYEIRIEAEGYHPWVRTGVVVGSYACGAVTENVRADLVPAN